MTRRPGDIVLFKVRRSKLWKYPLSWLIRKFQGNEVSHVAILVSSAPEGTIIVEAFYPRARKNLIDGPSYQDHEWAIVRPMCVSKEHAEVAARYAEELVGTKYDVKGLFALAWLFFLEWTLGVFIRDRLRPHDAESRLFCSELVTYCYENAGFPMAEHLGFKEAAQITPSDIASLAEHFDVVETSTGWAA